MIPDRELLRALFVQQLGLAPAAVVLNAGAEWMVSREKGETLCDVLARRGVLDSTRKILVESLVDEAISAAGGDPGATIDSLPKPMRESLDGISATLRSGEHPAVQVTSREGSGTSMPSFDSLETPENVGAEARGRYSFDTGKNGRTEELGKGGVGQVLLARDHFLQRNVAFKVLHRDITTSTSYDTLAVRQLEARFLREARVTAQLEHPSIVRVYELGRRGDGTLYYTMQRVRGRTLGQALIDARSLEGRLAFVPDVLAATHAVASAHHRQVIHRDLKPQNIMLGAHGETYVMDWGLARVLGRPERNARPMQLAPDLTGGRDMGPVGTPSYMSPEQAWGQHDAVDERSDVWGLGAILFELLTGRAPFIGRSPWDVLADVRSGTAPKVRELEPAAPPELVAICEKALDREPGRRYRNAGEMAEDLLRFQHGQRVLAYEYTTREVMGRLAVRYRALAAVIAAVLLLLLVAGVVGGAQVRRERDEARDLARFFLRELAPTLNETPGAFELGERLSVDALGAFSRDLDLKRGPVDERLMLAHAWNEQAMRASSGGQGERAVAARHMAAQVVAPLVAQRPNDPAVRLEAARLKMVDVDLLLDEGKEDEALVLDDALLADIDQLAALSPDNTDLLRLQRGALNRAGVVRANRGQTEQAIELYRRQVAVADHWNRVAPGEQPGSVLVSSMADLALIESWVSMADARRDAERAVAEGRRLLSGRESVAVRVSLGEALLALGRLQLGADDARAEAAFTEAQAAFAQQLRLQPEDPISVVSMIDTLVFQGDAARAWAEAQRVDSREEFGDALVAAAFLSGHDDRVLALRGEGTDPTHGSARAMSAIILSLRGDAAGALVELEPCLQVRCYEQPAWNGATVRARAQAAGSAGGPALRLAQALPGSLATRAVRDAAWQAFAAELRASVKK